jgi:hypothetical protein
VLTVVSVHQREPLDRDLEIAVCMTEGQ